MRFNIYIVCLQHGSLAAERQRVRARPLVHARQHFGLPGHCLGAYSQLGNLSVLAQSASSQGGGVSERGAGEPASSGNGAAEASASERYPERNPLSGGWAGGETGLRQWIEVRRQGLGIKK